MLMQGGEVHPEQPKAVKYTLNSPRASAARGPARMSTARMMDTTPTASPLRTGWYESSIIRALEAAATAAAARVSGVDGVDCSHTPASGFGQPRPPRARPSPGAVRGIPRPRPPSRVHAPTCSPLHFVGFGQPPPPNPSSASLSRRVPRHPPPAAAPARRRGHRLRSELPGIQTKTVTFSRTTPHHNLLERGGSRGLGHCVTHQVGA
jgi:hypothetical protein